MKSICILFIAGVIANGCVSTQPPEMPERLPHLIEQEPLPPMSEAFFTKHTELNLRILVGGDGSVLKAELLNPSGDSAWDALAKIQMKQWKFSPAVLYGKAVPMWVNFHAHVKYERPIYMGLAEIACENDSAADSVYALLKAGGGFESLAASFSVSDSKENHGNLGQVDISRYGEDVKKILIKLMENEYTEPVELGTHFVIFKRLSANTHFQ